jgi:hypothetical protein
MKILKYNLLDRIWNYTETVGFSILTEDKETDLQNS